eukprot:gene11460-9954_t
MTTESDELAHDSDSSVHASTGQVDTVSNAVPASSAGGINASAALPATDGCTASGLTIHNRAGDLGDNLTGCARSSLL